MMVEKNIFVVKKIILLVKNIFPQKCIARLRVKDKGEYIGLMGNKRR